MNHYLPQSLNPNQAELSFGGYPHLWVPGSMANFLLLVFLGHYWAKVAQSITFLLDICTSEEGYGLISIFREFEFMIFCLVYIITRNALKYTHYVYNFPLKQ